MKKLSLAISVICLVFYAGALYLASKGAVYGNYTKGIYWLLFAGLVEYAKREAVICIERDNGSEANK